MDYKTDGVDNWWSNEDPTFNYAIKRKNYVDLRDEDFAAPRMLVVVTKF